jgi:hypothetical protein
MLWPEPHGEIAVPMGDFSAGPAAVSSCLLAPAARIVTDPPNGPERTGRTLFIG